MAERQPAIDLPDKELEGEMGDRVKSWEAASETHLNLELPMIVRLDGCSFHTYTRGFRKPCDPLIYLPMISTTRDLVEKFNASLGYTESDEITLVFLPPKPDKEGKRQGLYSYRVQKICSITAGFASARFNYHSLLAAESEEAKTAVAEGKLDARIIERMKSAVAVFDARIFNAPTLVGAMESVYWRHHFDCHRNSISALGNAHFSYKELHGKGTGAILNMLREINVFYNDLPAEFRFGTFVKRKAVFHTRTEDCDQTKKVNKKKASSSTSTSPSAKEYIRTQTYSWSDVWDGSLRVLTDKYVNQEEYEAWVHRLSSNVTSPVAADSLAAAS